MCLNSEVFRWIRYLWFLKKDDQHFAGSCCGQLSEYNAQQTAPPTVAQRSSGLFPFQATALVGMGEGKKAYLASLLGCPTSYLVTTDANSCLLLAR